MISRESRWQCWQAGQLLAWSNGAPSGRAGQGRRQTQGALCSTWGSLLRTQAHSQMVCIPTGDKGLPQTPHVLWRLVKAAVLACSSEGGTRGSKVGAIGKAARRLSLVAESTAPSAQMYITRPAG